MKVEMRLTVVLSGRMCVCVCTSMDEHVNG